MTILFLLQVVGQQAAGAVVLREVLIPLHHLAENTLDLLSFYSFRSGSNLHSFETKVPLDWRCELPSVSSRHLPSFKGSPLQAFRSRQILVRRPKFIHSWTPSNFYFTLRINHVVHSMCPRLLRWKENSCVWTDNPPTCPTSPTYLLILRRSV